MSTTVFIVIPRHIAFTIGRGLIQWATRPVVRRPPPRLDTVRRAAEAAERAARERDRHIERYLTHVRQVL